MDFGILGPLQVGEEGRLLDLGSPKQRAVLGVLLVDANQVVSVDRLIHELWGDQPPAAATGTLQAYVSNLRRVLEPDRAPRELPRVLVTQPPGYLLRVPADAFDAARFEAAAATGRHLMAEGGARDARAVLDEALGFWRGPALCDFADEPFAQTEAARLGELRLLALEDRLEADVALGGHSAAAAEADALLATHPLRERLWGLLMLALYRSGRQAGALRAYQAARRTLGDELGIEPGPALRRLEADILAQAPTLEWSLPALVPPARAPAGPPGGEPAAAAGAGHGFFGRAAELSRLRGVLASASSGRGGAVLVAGEAGIGKTRLAEELVAEATAGGWTAVWGGAVEGGGTPAYWPWVQVVRALAARPDGNRLLSALGVGASELTQVVPEVMEAAGPLEVPPALDPDTARLRLFQAVATVLERVGASGPLLVVLDDLHWADAASLQLASYLAAHLGRCRVVLAGLYRPDEVGPSHPLADTLAALARHGVAERLTVEGLSAAEVGQVVAATTGAPLSDAAAESLRRRTEGNPFFVAELARLLAAERGSGPEAVPAAVPSGVRDVVRRRLSRLPDQTVALLSMAAVAGRTFELGVLERAAGVGGERALELVEAALLNGLVEDASAVGRFRFSHDLVRDVIAADLSAVRRARVHARLGEAIETLHDDPGHAVELAHHFSEAAPVLGPDRAIAHCVRAAGVEAGRLAHQGAEELLRRALDLAGRPAEGDSRRRELPVLVALASLLALTRGYGDPELGALLARTRDVGEALSGGPAPPPVLWGLMAHALVAAHHDEAHRVAGLLLELAIASGDPVELVSAHVALAVTGNSMGDFTAGRSHAEAAVELAARLPPDAAVTFIPLQPAVAARTFLAWALWLQGEQGRAVDELEEAVRLATDLRQPLSRCHALHLSSWMAAWDRDVARVREQAGQVLSLAEGAGFRLYHVLASVHEAWARAEAGDPSGDADLERAITITDAGAARVEHTFWLGFVAERRLRAGQADAALAIVEEALAFVARTGQRYNEAELLRLRAEAGLARDPRAADSAAADLGRALAVARSQGADWARARIVESLRRHSLAEPS